MEENRVGSHSHRSEGDGWQYGISSRTRAYTPQSRILLSSVNPSVFQVLFNKSQTFSDTTAVPSRHYRGTLAALPRCMTGESKKCNYAVTRACARDVAVSVPSCDIRSDTRQMVWLFREKLLFLQV